MGNPPLALPLSYDILPHAISYLKLNTTSWHCYLSHEIKHACVVIRHISNERDHFTFEKRVRCMQKISGRIYCHLLLFWRRKRGKCVHDLVRVFVPVSCENAPMAVVSVLFGLAKTFLKVSGSSESQYIKWRSSRNIVQWAFPHISSSLMLLSRRKAT